MRTFFKYSIVLFVLEFVSPSAQAQYSIEDQQAIDEYNKIIKSPFSSKIDKADALNGVGFVYRFNLEFDKSITAHQESLALFEKEEDEWGQAICKRYIAFVYMAKESYTLALSWMESSFHQFENNNFLEEAAISLIQIGYIYTLKFETKIALEKFERAYEITVKANDISGQIYALSMIGFLYQNQGDLPNALNNFEKCLKLARAAKNKGFTADALLNIGWVYFEQGNFVQAIEMGKLSYDLNKAIGSDLGCANSLNLIGGGYKELGQYQTALDYLKKSFYKYEYANDKIGIGTSYNNLATVYFEMGDIHTALKYHELGLKTNLEIGDQYGTTLSTSNVATTHFYLGDVDKGKEIALKAEKLALAFGNPRLIKICKKLLFEINDKQGLVDEAERYVFEMIDMNNKFIEINFPTLSESEKEKFFDNISKEYMAFNAFALRRKEKNQSITETVFNNTLHHKGLLLKSTTAMRNAILTSNDTLLINDYNQWILLKSEIADAYAKGKKTESLEIKANTLEKSLVSRSQEFSDLEKVQNLTWKDVQSNLNENEAAVEFVHFNTFNDIGRIEDKVQYCALIVTKKSTYPEMIPICFESELEKILGAFGGNNLNYINEIYGTNATPNAALYQLIWQPIVPNLLNCNTVYIAPTGLLHRVSFAALAKDNKTLLCDTYNLQLQSSTSKIALPDEFEIDTDWSITLFGGIDYNTEKSSKKIWSFLEGTKVEVDNISQIFKDKSYNVTSSTTEEGFKENAPKSDIIHLSTHGFFYPDPDKLMAKVELDSAENGDLVFRGSTTSFGVKNFVFNKNPLMRSGLVLSGANDVWNNTEISDKEDGVLTAFEVAQIDLRKTGLVVLSACETGLGDINGSEGVYGLQRSFKMAGVKYIIMSLWQVPDKETQEFMTLFYKKLVQLRNPKPAFAETQLTMRKKYDPYYWAAFVLIE